MISDQDIRRSAWLIIKRWGADAAAFAAIRADALLDAGDLEGSAVWRSIAKEIEKLQAEKPEPGETVQWRAFQQPAARSGYVLASPIDGVA